MERIFRKISNVRSKDRVEEDKGYKTLMSVVDRKVFGVEDSKVSKKEFEVIENWIVEEFGKVKGGERSLVGKVIKKEPLILAEVIGGEPIYVEIQDFDVRYRVNIYTGRKEVEIKVLDSIKEKELQYGYGKEVSYQL